MGTQILDTPAQERQPLSLGAMRLIAGGLLIAMSALYLLAISQHGQGAAWGYVGSFAEAAMIGGLAD